MLTYVEGDRAGGTARIQRVVVDNDAARVRKLAGLLRTTASAPGLGSFKAQLEEVATILDTSGGGGAGPAAPDPDAKPEAKADAKGEPRGGATDDARTKTVTAILAGHPRAYACAPLGKTSQAYAGSTCLRLGIGPLVVSDLVTSAACPGDILVMAGPSDAPAWVVGSVPPRERFAMHGARLVVGPEDGRARRSGPLRDGAPARRDVRRHGVAAAPLRYRGGGTLEPRVDEGARSEGVAAALDPSWDAAPAA